MNRALKTESKVVENIYINSTTRLLRNRHGIRILFIQSGEIGRFSFQAMLVEVRSTALDEKGLIGEACVGSGVVVSRPVDRGDSDALCVAVPAYLPEVQGMSAWLDIEDIDQSCRSKKQRTFRISTILIANRSIKSVSFRASTRPVHCQTCRRCVVPAVSTYYWSTLAYLSRVHFVELPIILRSVITLM